MSFSVWHISLSRVLSKSESHSSHVQLFAVHGILQARILEWVAYPFSSGSSRPRDRTRVFCIAGRFFTNWAIKEAPQVYPCCCKWQNFIFFYGWVVFSHVYMPHLPCPFIRWWIIRLLPYHPSFKDKKHACSKDGAVAMCSAPHHSWPSDLLSPLLPTLLSVSWDWQVGMPWSAGGCRRKRVVAILGRGHIKLCVWTGANAAFLSVPPRDCKLYSLSLSCPISLKELAPPLASWDRQDPSCHSPPHLSLIPTWPVPAKMSLPEGPVSWAETSQLPLCVVLSTVVKYENYEERSMFTSHLLCIISMSLR